MSCCVISTLISFDFVSFFLLSAPLEAEPDLFDSMFCADHSLHVTKTRVFTLSFRSSKTTAGMLTLDLTNARSLSQNGLSLHRFFFFVLASLINIVFSQVSRTVSRRRPSYIPHLFKEVYFIVVFFVGFFFGFFLFFVASGFCGFWLLWLLASVASGFCGFWLSWLSWLLWLLAFVAFGFLAYPSICLYLSIYLSIFLSFFWQLFSFLFLYLLFLLFSLQRRNQTRKQASKQASTSCSPLDLVCCWGGALRPPPQRPPRHEICTSSPTPAPATKSIF